MDGPVGAITGDPLFRAKATLVALSRSSGPGVENRGRSAAVQIYPFSLSLAREEHHMRPLVIPYGPFHFAQGAGRYTLSRRRAHPDIHPEIRGWASRRRLRGWASSPWAGGVGQRPDMYTDDSRRTPDADDRFTPAFALRCGVPYTGNQRKTTQVGSERVY
jgi:hypothetical protein